MGPGVSYECRCKSGSHIVEDHFYPEIIDSNTLEPQPAGGQGELVLVRSPDGALADALATALCNRLQGPGDVKAVVGYARRFVKHGLTGIFAQCGGAIGVWGDMELTAVEQDS